MTAVLTLISHSEMLPYAVQGL